MSKELDAVEVEYLTLQQVGNLPDAGDGRDDEVVLPHSLCQHLHAGALVSLGILENIDTSESLLATEVFANDSNEVVEMLLLLKVCHLKGKLVKVKNEVVQFHLAPSCSFLMFSTNSVGTSVTTIGFFHPDAMASLERPSSRSSEFCL